MANPVNEADRQDYFDSLYHSEAVVGVNTTAMIEAAIVGRTVHSVLADEFRDTQDGTLHFRYLLAENGGFLRVATSLAEHAQQVGRDAARRPTSAVPPALASSPASSVPHGVEAPTTPVLVDALERLASSGRRARGAHAAVAYPLRPCSAPPARSRVNRGRPRSAALGKSPRSPLRRARRVRPADAAARRAAAGAADGEPTGVAQRKAS